MPQRTKTNAVEAFIGRQPIFDRQLTLSAHELLFRSAGDLHAARIESGNQATSQLLIHSMLDVGLDRIAGDRPVFINMPQNVIISGLAKVLPPERCVLEILESVPFTPEVLLALKDLKLAGYRLALDDFEYSEERAVALELADYVKLDVRALSEARLKSELQLVAKYGVATIAEKIENLSEFRLCHQFGFDYFQGYFLCRPDVLPAKSPSVDILSVALLLEACQDPLTEIRTVAKMAARNASLSYRLLQAANSALHGRHHEISSVQEAVNFLGIAFVSRIATLFLVSGLGGKPSFALVQAFQRACICEQLAESGSSGSHLYLVGLLSALDFLTDQPIELILSPLPIAEPVKSAIIRHEGPMGKILASVLAYEQDEWTVLDRDPSLTSAVAHAYWDVAPQVREMEALVEQFNRQPLLSPK